MNPHSVGSALRLVTIATLFIVLLAPNLHPAHLFGLFDPYAYNEKRLLEIALLLLLAVASFLSWRPHHPWQQLLNRFPTTAWLILLALFVLGLLSLQQSALMRMGWSEFGLVFLIFLGVTVIGTARHINPDLDRMLIIAICGMAILFFLRFIFRYLDASPLQYMIANRDFLSDFTNPRFFGQFQSWVLPLLAVIPLWWNRQPQHKIWFLLLTLPAASWVVLLLFSGSRGPWLGLLVASITVTLFLRKQALPWLTSLFTAILIGSLLYGIIFGALSQAPDTVAQTAERITNLSGRLGLWNEAWIMSRDYPLLGVSPHHFSYYFNAGHPHMSILLWAAEYGWLSTLLLLSLMIWAFSRWILQLKRQADLEQKQIDFRVALTASMLTAATHSLVSGVTVMPLSQIMLIIVVGWMVGIHFSDRPIQPIRWFPLKMIASWILVSWVSYNFAISVWPEARYVINGPHSEMTVFNPIGNFEPRFWHQGPIPWLQLPSDQ